MNDFSQKNMLLGNPIQAFRKLRIISAVQKDLQLNDLQTQSCLMNGHRWICEWLMDKPLIPALRLHLCSVLVLAITEGQGILENSQWHHLVQFEQSDH